MATIKDIAKRTGLGLATISKYLNGGNVLERNRIAIEEAIEDLDFTVNEFARGLKSNHSRTVGVIIPELSNLFITTVITTMEDILRRNGYGVIVCDCRTDEAREREALQFLLAKRVDGILSMAVTADGSHLLPALEREIPIVLIDRMVPELEGRVGAVLVDNVEASACAVRTLVKAGHARIGIVLGPDGIYTAEQRLEGYRKAMGEAGLPAKRELIASGDYTLQGGYEGIKQLLARSSPTAVFVTNYDMTLGAVLAVNELGLHLGKDLSFIGFDDMYLSQVIRPRPTLITQPMEAIGVAAAEMLLDRCCEEGKNLPPRITVLPTGMVVGDSVCPIYKEGTE